MAFYIMDAGTALVLMTTHITHKRTISPNTINLIDALLYELQDFHEKLFSQT
jgi:hypothetical protein